MADSLIAYLQDRVQEIVDGFRGVERRRVLASDGWFVAGKLFTLVTRQGRIVVRLPDESAQDELLALDGATMWKIPGKAPMRGWILVPESMHDDAAELTKWLRRAFTLAPELKTKKRKPKPKPKPTPKPKPKPKPKK